MSIWDYDYICLCGKRETNQDRVLINDDMILVLDGHGYRKNTDYPLHVVDLVIKHLPEMLKTATDQLKPDSNPDEITEVIKECCLDIDEFIFNKYQKIIGGTTMTGVILIQGKIFIVNIGDSETVAINGIVPIIATVKHKPTDVEESDRIVSRGGFISYRRVNGNLAISRVFGDYEFGKINLDGSFNVKNPIWAMPDVIHLNEKYTNIFLYSDGFGDHIDLSSLVTIAFKNKNDYSKENSMSIKLAHAVLDFSHDNITVVSIQPKSDEFAEYQKVEDSLRLSGESGEEHGL